ncbi:DUF3344 domain-containing protein [Methanosarcina barkeri]|uniref:DUF3344 domain-containing protein n=1 Tax=Methanosarcina barkeri CM1 TaxID=796385 RepID=A0A0G3CEL0_METBA|nr:DUF3344 domain-containing protein [Methanosarcina barkeri]AKJ38403.1 hypothetical protein MCM1_1353 [Methanosarcina barkeri CM1]
MNKPRIKDKMGLFLGLGILMFSMLCAPAFALGGEYNYEGYPLQTIENGTLKGDVYISAGDNCGLNDSSWSKQPNTLITNFTDVPTSGIEWAELKVGVWGGSRNYAGWVTASLNNNTSSSIPVGTSNLYRYDPSPNATGCGSIVWLANYTCTDVVQNLTAGDTSTITANVTAWQNSTKFDGRIYGSVLIVGYESGDCYTQYWINQDLLNLHKNTTSPATYSDLDANFTWFNGTAYKPCPLGNTTLTVAYFAGDDDQNDYLYFNVPNDDDTPYNLSNFNWNIASHDFWKLDNNNVANETCDGLSGTHTYFDLHTFGVKNLTNYNDGNNYAIFWRGHGNDTGGETEIYDPPYTYPILTINPNTESYYTPYLAVFKTTKITTYDFSEDTAGRAGEDVFAYRYKNNSRAPITNDVPDIEFTPAQYTNIKADDGIFQQDETDADGNYAAHRFVFDASCCANASNFDAFNVTWNGRGYHDAGGTSNGAYLYIWNFNTGAYEELDNCDGIGTEQYLTGEKTDNLGNYINNGQVIVLAEQKTAHDMLDASHIDTDYVKLLLKPKA